MRELRRVDGVRRRRAFDGIELSSTSNKFHDKIQASAGPAAEHQLKRPLLDHVESANGRLVEMLTAAGYRIEPPAQSGDGSFVIILKDGSFVMNIILAHSESGWFWKLDSWRDDMRVGPFASEEAARAHAFERITRKTKEDMR